MLAQPSAKWLAEAAERANESAKGDALLEQNLLFWALYGDEYGFWGNNKANRTLWMAVHNGDRDAVTWPGLDGPQKFGGRWPSRRRMRRREFIQRHFRIKNKRGETVPFVLNQAQRDLEARILKMERRGLPVRIVICKARQQGFSTLIQAIGLERALRRRNFHALLVAHRRQTSESILAKMTMMRRALARRDDRTWEFSMEREGRGALEFGLPMRSMIETDSSDSDEPGRGETIDFLHMTETAHWNNAKEKAKALEQTVPEVSGSFAFDESTANGDVGYYPEKFRRAYYPADSGDATETLTGWAGHFSPWFTDQEYRWTYVRAQASIPKELESAILATLTEQEKLLLARKYLLKGKGWVSVDVDQLAWRRWCRRNKCNDDWATFDEQYPGTAEDAFQASGRPAFNVQRLRDALHSGQEPVTRGNIAEKGSRPVAELVP